jgi:8-hydroxy-5-deazaflavin:NADPH oxidoreductase
MKIAIVGSGNIGATLGRKWAKANHAVTFAVRDVDDPKYRQLLETLDGAGSVASIAEAAGSADVIVFAIPGAAVGSTVAGLGEVLDGKIIIDPSNNPRQAEMNSLAAISAEAPTAKLFRAFNSLSWENLETPRLGNTQIDLFYCGDPGEANDVVAGLIADVGLRPMYAGNLDQAAAIDTLTRLWMTLANRQGYGRRSAFKLVTE